MRKSLLQIVSRSTAHATDQILFINCFIQQLMYSMMMDQQGPKHVEV